MTFDEIKKEAKMCNIRFNEIIDELDFAAMKSEAEQNKLIDEGKRVKERRDELDEMSKEILFEELKEGLNS